MRSVLLFLAIGSLGCGRLGYHASERSIDAAGFDASIDVAQDGRSIDAAPDGRPIDAPDEDASAPDAAIGDSGPDAPIAIEDASEPDAPIAIEDASEPDTPIEDASEPDGGSNEVIALSLGRAHSCALRAGEVLCWGENLDGQLGDGSVFSRNRPVRVVSLPPATMIAAGSRHTCAATEAGAAHCWGADEFGQLGDPLGGPRLEPGAPVAMLASPPQIDTGSDHACALRTDMSVVCWGSNSDGQLGGGMIGGSSESPVAIGRAAEQVSGGAFHTCARPPIGGTRCWGRNTNGQLGDGSTTSSGSPVPVSSITEYVEIAAGGRHTCGLTPLGDVECWGANPDRQLHVGSLMPDVTAPRRVLGVAGAISIAAGDDHTCAILDTGQIVCWGSNEEGQCGNGSTSRIAAPSPVVGIIEARLLACGSEHCCAMSRTSPAIWCWGSGGSGRLGNGASLDSPAPVRVLLP